RLDELERYIRQNLKGFTDEEIKKRLRLSKWTEDDINLVLGKVAEVSDIDSLKSFMICELVRGKDQDAIESMLFAAGWPKNIVKRELLKLRTTVKTDQEEVERAILGLFKAGLTDKEVREKLLSNGYNKDIVDILLFNKFGHEKNLEKLSNFVNLRLVSGDSIDQVKKMLINAQWGIDIIDEIVHDDFMRNDMKYLLALDSYIKRAFDKGYTKKIITNDLLVKKWADEYIDLVMLEVHIVDDKIDKVKKYLNLRIGKGDSKEKIVELLVKVGWGRKIVNDVFDNKRI
ncbi:hypothetical protein JXC34_07305, partial [Candidatus Woesearchaeota archaeon]|nr:hypothetical protein [Candidatus Woesearchaeota archaeon]